MGSPGTLAFQHGGAGPQRSSRTRLGRHALAGEGGGVDGQLVGIAQHEVGRDAITRLEEDEIAGHQRHGVHGRPVAVPHDHRPTGEQGPELARGSFGPVLLGEGEQGVDHHHHEDGDAELWEPGDEGQKTRSPEQQGEEVGQLR